MPRRGGSNKARTCLYGIRLVLFPNGRGCYRKHRKGRAIMLTFKKEGLVLSKTFAAFESDGVLNPAVIQEGAVIHMF